jgi:hypothetical protein
MNSDQPIPPPLELRPMPVPVSPSIQDVEAIAVKVARSGLYGLTDSQAFVLMQIAIAEGLHPIQAVRRYHVIEGKPSMRADAMQAEFQRHGGRIKWVETTADACEAEFSHPVFQPDPVKIRFTLKEFVASGVATAQGGLKKNWRTFPAAMLRARVISAGVRMIDPGVVVGIYTPEEVGDFDRPIETTARTIEPTPPPRAISHTNGSKADAEPIDVTAFVNWVGKRCRQINASWLQKHTGPQGELPEGLGELLTTWQLSGHLFKEGLKLARFTAPKESKGSQRDKFTAIWFGADPAELKESANEYIKKLSSEAELKLIALNAHIPKAEDESQAREPGSDDDNDDDFGALQSELAAESTQHQ